jgi:hypothetical protein
MKRKLNGIGLVLAQVIALAVVGIWERLFQVGLAWRLAIGDDSVGGASLTTLSAMLKNFYLPGFNNQLNNATVLFDRLSRVTPEVVGGSKVVMFANTKRHSGIGARGERSPTPIPGSSGGVNPESTTSNVLLSIGFTKQVLDNMKTDQMAFGRAMETELETANADGRLVLNHMLWGDKTARLARVDGAPAAGVITIDNDSLFNNAAGARALYLYEGMYLCAIDSSTGAVVQNGMLVTAISEGASSTTVTVTIAGVATSGATADNNYLVRGSESGEGQDYNQGVSGIMATLSTSNNTYWGLDRSSAANAFWRPQRYNAANIALTENLWRAPLDRVKKFGGNPNNQSLEGKLEDLAIVTSIEGVTVFANLLLGLKRYVNTVSLDGGWSAITCHGKPMIEDPSCPLGVYTYLNWADYQLYSQIGQIGFQVDDTDGLTLRKVPGYQLYELLLYSRLELGCKRPNRQAIMYGVTMTPILPS